MTPISMSRVMSQAEPLRMASRLMRTTTRSSRGIPWHLPCCLRSDSPMPALLKSSGELSFGPTPLASIIYGCHYCHNEYNYTYIAQLQHCLLPDFNTPHNRQQAFTRVEVWLLFPPFQKQQQPLRILLLYFLQRTVTFPGFPGSWVTL